MKTIQDAVFDDLAASFGDHHRCVATGLIGSAIALALATVVKRHPITTLVVTPTGEQAKRLADDLKFFAWNVRGLERMDIMELPCWDVDPYDVLSPHASLTIERLRALFHLKHGTPRTIVVTSAAALLKKTIPGTEFDQLTQRIELGDTIDRDTFVHNLVHTGYLSTDLVEDAGCFAVRGGVIDVFSPLQSNPVRIELVGDDVGSIREFDPVSQRSIRQLTRLLVIPAREEILSDELVREATTRLKALSDRMSCPSHVRRRIVDDLSMGIYFPGIEYMLGLLFSSLSSCLEYVDPAVCNTIRVEPESHLGLTSRYYQALEARFATIDQTERLVPPPESLFERPETLISDLQQRSRLTISPNALSHVEHAPNRPADHNPPIDGVISRPAYDLECRFRIEPTSGLRQLVLADLHQGEMLLPLVERIASWKEDGNAIFVACTSTTRAHRLRDLLNPHSVTLGHPRQLVSLDTSTSSLPDGFDLVPIIGGLSGGFRHPAGRLVLLSENDIFGEKVRSVTLPREFLKNSISSFSQLNRGDPVVHAIHGIGIFRGFRKIELEDLINDFLLIEYLGGDKLYLPVHRLNELQRYVGAGSTPKLDKMGGATFARTKRKVRRNVLKMAHELLKLYAARAAQPGFVFTVDEKEMAELEASFPFEETPDQTAAIEAVFRDMRDERPMDRLVCGDVGYGKTEIAIRASYLAVLNGKQVAILTPTTVLALQHFRTFAQRFADYPITVEMLTRFRPPRAQKTILDSLREGKVDILIGTHRLLSDDIEFDDLGLLVVDEEHRFGVRQKERIKRLKQQIDVLSMSATPIPRTLHMAMSGIREFSLITTPPRDRLAIRTFHLEFSQSKIQEVIRSEIQRGGQVFFVHNRVGSIGAIARQLDKLVPEMSIGVAHGQMGVRELEKVMVDFMERKYHVLCCTAIIESGLDIPSVNTIIINRADQFGLAQLYQLRGRVGRSTKRAYCYLMTQVGRALPKNTLERLKMLVEFSELGAGFKIASEDLEMRGAGELLGSSQSGQVAAVGLDMYCELLERAITDIKGDEQADRIDPDVDLRLPAFIPDDYMPDFHARLHYYKQLSDALDAHVLLARMEEIEDRFGPYPVEVENLRDLVQIKLELRKLGVTSLSFRAGNLVARFDTSSPIERSRIVELVNRSPERYRLTEEQRLVIKLTSEESKNLAPTVKNLLHKLY